MDKGERGEEEGGRVRRYEVGVRREERRMEGGRRRKREGRARRYEVEGARREEDGRWEEREVRGRGRGGGRREAHRPHQVGVEAAGQATGVVYQGLMLPGGSILGADLLRGAQVLRSGGSSGTGEWEPKGKMREGMEYGV